MLVATLLAVAPATAEAQAVGSTLVAAHSDRCLMADGGSLADDIIIVQADCDGGGDQLFTTTDVGDGFVEIVAAHSGKCLQARGGSTDYATRIVQGPCDGSTASQWDLTAVAGGTRLTVRHSGLCLDIFGGSLDSGADGIQWPCHGNDNQVFVFDSIATPEPDPDPDPDPVGSTLVPSHSNLCVEAPGSPSALVQQACDGGDDQLYTTADAGGGFVEIMATSSGLCLGAEGAATARGASIVEGPCDGSPSSQWELVAVAGGVRLEVRSTGFCLDVYGGSTTAGARLIQWTCHGGANQVFVFDSIPDPDPDPVVSTVVASHSNLCVEAPGQPSPLIQAVCDGGDDQRYTTTDLGSGYVEVQSVASGLCLHVQGASTRRGASIIEFACNGSQNSHWRPVPVPGGVRLEVRHTGLCLDVYGGSITAGARLIQWTCHGRSNQTFVVEPAGDPGDDPGGDNIGRWSDVIDMPLIPVAAANIADGKLLLWSAYDRYNFGGSRGYTQTAIYDPATGAISERQVANTGHDMFCPGIANMPDGRILVSGGSNSGETSIYNPSTDSWEDAPDMQLGRGYQSNVTLSDGSAFTVGGSWSGGVTSKPAEVFRNGTWQLLPGIDPGPAGLHTADGRGTYRADNHMWLFAWENGQVFHAGPSRAMHWIDTSGSGSVTSAGSRGSDGDAMNGNAVMFDAGQILSVGGAPNYENDRGTGNANVIDITSGNPTVRAVDDLNHPRTLAHSVVLPSGEVVVVGGQGIGRLFTDDEATLIPELFDPDTGTWTELAPMATPRTYHSVALLLRDGRVLTGGGGLCGGCAYNHPDVEILTPPYLLDANGDPAPRPTITSAPASAANGSSISVSVAGGASEFALVRMANSTHSVNNAQRRIPVDFTATGGNGYSVQIPASAGVVPPGPYMLFALNAAGAPSIAAEIQIG